MKSQSEWCLLTVALSDIGIIFSSSGTFPVIAVSRATPGHPHHPHHTVWGCVHCSLEWRACVLPAQRWRHSIVKFLCLAWADLLAADAD